MQKVMISSNPTALGNVKPHITVEAEYGDVVVEGSILTLAHHGIRKDNPAPCISDISGVNIPNDAVIGISHLDLDTLGALAKILDYECGDDAYRSFWCLAAFVDVNGPHRLRESEASDEDVRKLFAYWAYSQEHRIYPPRDGSVADVTDDVHRHLEILTLILAPPDYELYDYTMEEFIDRQKELLEGGDKFREDEEELNKKSFVKICNPESDKRVILRRSPGFTNHLYTAPDGTVCGAVVGYNEWLQSITLSFAEGERNACAIMQRIFGPEAGGHRGIAGTPRDVKFEFDSAENLAVAVSCE